MNRNLGSDPERAITIDGVPLDWRFRPGVKLDFRHFDDGYVMGAADVKADVARIGHEPQPLDIVVVNTAAGAAHGGDRYVDSGCTWVTRRRCICWSAASG